MRKTIAITSVIAIAITSVALVKKIISDKFHDDVENNNIDETYMNTPSSSIEEDEGLSIRIDEDDEIISFIKNLMSDECSSFKYATLEAALSQAENGEIQNAIETIALIGEKI